MKTDSPLLLYIKIALVSILIAFLGLSSSPRAVSALLVRSYKSASDGDYLDAAVQLSNVAKSYPWRFGLNIQAARYAYQEGDYEDAIQYLEQPGTVNHLGLADQILLGDAYNQIGNASKAETIWKNIADAENSNEAYKRLADLYIQQRDYISAISAIQKLLSSDPTDTHLYYQIGILYAATDPLKALPFLTQAAQIDPAKASSAKTLHDKIQTASLFDQPAYSLLASGRQLANINEWSLASEAFKRATEQDPKYADAWAFLGEAQQHITKQSSSSTSGVGLSELEQALKLDEKSVLANTFMGLYWERQQDYSHAQQYLEQAIAINPKDSYLYSELGNILSKAGDLPAAQSAYESAIKLTPQDPQFYRLLAEFALDNQIQIHELALPAARQAVMLNSSDPDSLDVMAQVMLALQDYHSAERYSRDAVQSNPQFAPAYLHLGMAYIYLKEPLLAKDWLNKAKMIDPNSWVAAQSSRMMAYYFP